MILCLLFFNVNILKSQTLEVSLSPRTYPGGYHVSCYGANDGRILAAVSNGTAPYTYLWSNSITTYNNDGLSAGSFSVVVKDAVGTTGTAQITLIQPGLLQGSLIKSDYNGFGVTGYGEQDGSLHWEINGGTTPYTYLWNNNSTSCTLQNIAAGAYTCTLTDANGCSISDNETLTEPTQLQVSVSNIVHITCFGKNNGSAKLNISGGVSPYSQIWDNGSFEIQPDNLVPDTNKVMIIDNNGIKINTYVVINEPAKISAEFIKSNYPPLNNNVSCYNCFNGSITTTTQGGISPYTYLWDDANSSTTANLSNINGGTYHIIITDNNGCTYEEDVLMKMPQREDWGQTGNSGSDPSTQFLGTTDAVDFNIRTNDTTRLVFTSNGKIGVNTNTPLETFDINGSLKIGNKLRFTDNIITEVSESNGNGNALLYGRGPAGGGGLNYVKPACLSSMAYQQSNIFLGMLSVQSSTNNTFTQSGTSTAAELFLGSDGSNCIVDAAGQSGSLLVNYYCGKDMYVGNNSSGNLIINQRIGIGINNPLQKLHISGDSFFDGKIGIGVVSLSEPLHVQGNSLLNGNVHVGDNSSPHSKLVVEGKVYAREFHVNLLLNWPDYVFKENYNLTPLNEVENYIIKNGHLMEIPCEKEIRQEGISITEMMILQMKKIEELTLYIIELKKQQDFMEGEIKTIIH